MPNYPCSCKLCICLQGPPFIFYDHTKKHLGNDAFQGFCKDLIDRLSQDLNFTYQMYIVTPGNYGGGTSNGTSNGMIRDLIRKVSALIMNITSFERFSLLNWQDMS